MTPKVGPVIETAENEMKTSFLSAFITFIK